MVDAGYLLRQAIEMVSSRVSVSRAELEIPDPAKLVELLVDKARATLDLRDKELLRVYWYDGVLTNGFTPQQRAIAHVDDVQLRSGTINGRGQQKGVDSLIVIDLIELATHHAICDAVLVTGDSDLAVGIEFAQRRGVRVGVLGVEDPYTGVQNHQSFEITSRADRICLLGKDELNPVFRYTPAKKRVVAKRVAAAPPLTDVPVAPVGPLSASRAEPTTAPAAVAAPPAPPPVALPPAQDTIDTANQQRIIEAVKAFIAERGIQPAEALQGKGIRPAIDKPLLHHVFTVMDQRRLTDAERMFARQAFRNEV